MYILSCTYKNYQMNILKTRYMEKCENAYLILKNAKLPGYRALDPSRCMLASFTLQCWALLANPRKIFCSLNQILDPHLDTSTLYRGVPVQWGKHSAPSPELDPLEDSNDDSFGRTGVRGPSCVDNLQTQFTGTSVIYWHHILGNLPTSRVGNLPDYKNTPILNIDVHCL